MEARGEVEGRLGRGGGGGREKNIGSMEPLQRGKVGIAEEVGMVEGGGNGGGRWEWWREVGMVEGGGNGGGWWGWWRGEDGGGMWGRREVGMERCGDGGEGLES